MRTLFLLLPLSTLIACKAEQPQWAQEGRQTAVPAPVCREVAKGIARLRATGIEITDKGEAALPVDAWNAMPAQQHDDLLRTIALNASCLAGAQSDAQPVAVRGDDGSLLARRDMSTRIDPSEALRD